ncbi:hypothetical protein VC81_03765 [Levilactobacillus spicheri]|uniref:Uncharacterized protein n=2 Tax=Levilactobacillus spicheri TaxID=216463 RepID=A0A0F3RSK6_9LACO|nr:hypothetical protein VC81_06350 [Levilactobacillus spicheri]KJW13589.1 hypothetical protein VC81_03765 [Levilactobacillus spicheri]
MSSGADAVLKRLAMQKRRLKQLNGMEVSVGAIKSVPEHTPEELQKIVRYNEYGTNKIPARSFLRGAVYRNSNHGWRFVSREAVKAVVAGKLTGDAAYKMVGDRMVKDVRHQIDIVGPANAPSTIKKKGRNQPLVDTGGLYRSIDKEVLKRGRD